MATQPSECQDDRAPDGTTTYCATIFSGTILHLDFLTNVAVPKGDPGGVGLQHPDFRGDITIGTQNGMCGRCGGWARDPRADHTIDECGRSMYMYSSFQIEIIFRPPVWGRILVRSVLISSLILCV